MTIAHISETTGKYSQMIAKAALTASGWSVAETETDEAYDFVIRDPLSGAWFEAQVKTIRRRKDRDNQFVVYTTNGKGEPYSPDDIRYIVAVLAENGETPRVFMFENEGRKEVWRSEPTAERDWVEMSIALDRDFLLDETRIELIEAQKEAELKSKEGVN